MAKLVLVGGDIELLLFSVSAVSAAVRELRGERELRGDGAREAVDARPAAQAPAAATQACASLERAFSLIGCMAGQQVKRSGKAAVFLKAAGLSDMARRLSRLTSRRLAEAYPDVDFEKDLRAALAALGDAELRAIALDFFERGSAAPLSRGAGECSAGSTMQADGVSTDAIPASESCSEAVGPAARCAPAVVAPGGPRRDDGDGHGPGHGPRRGEAGGRPPCPGGQERLQLQHAAALAPASWQEQPLDGGACVLANVGIKVNGKFKAPVNRGVVAHIDPSSIDGKGMCDSTCGVLARTDKLSPDIGSGDCDGADLDAGAGDQGISVGHAADVAEGCMPETQSRKLRWSSVGDSDGEFDE